MIFATENAITDIIAGKKTQTRRLVKEGDGYVNDYFAVLRGKKRRRLWYRGQVLSVQSGRGKPCLKWCPGCKSVWGLNNPNFRHNNLPNCKESMPLRIRITSIRKEKLLDISEEDAKKEGFSGREQFLRIFSEINFKGNRHALAAVHPDVWVLEFSVVK